MFQGRGMAYFYGFGVEGPIYSEHMHSLVSQCSLRKPWSGSFVEALKEPERGFLAFTQDQSYSLNLILTNTHIRFG